MRLFATLALFAWITVGTVGAAHSTSTAVYFSGQSVPCSACGGTSGAFNGELFFDYDVSPTISVALSLPSVRFSGFGFVSYGGVLSADVNDGSGYLHLALNFNSGYVQYGTCPSHCAFLTVRDFSFASPAPVPGPTAGGGLIALLALLVFAFAHTLPITRPRPASAAAQRPE